jgi:hypothetical protein
MRVLAINWIRLIMYLFGSEWFLTTRRKSNNTNRQMARYLHLAINKSFIKTT